MLTSFFEPSTRTRTTFELAAKRLSADVLNINIATSAATKGESLLDTLFNLEAMNTDMFIVRHPESGAAEFMSNYVSSHVSVINAGDGRHAHPTQAMLDMFTIRKHCKDFSKLSVAIVGDIFPFTGRTLTNRSAEYTRHQRNTCSGSKNVTACKC